MSLFSILGIGNGKIKDALRRGAIIIDIRTAAEFDRGKVQDSINIPVDRININLRRIVQMSGPIIICSDSDSENERVIDVLKANGVKEIYNGGNWTKLCEDDEIIIKFFENLMKTQTVLSKFLSFFLTKIIIGVSIIVGVVALVEWLGRPLLAKTQLPENSGNVIVAIAESASCFIDLHFSF